MDNDDIVLQKCKLRLTNIGDKQFIKELFAFFDVKENYDLTDDLARDINAFVDYLIKTNRQGSELNYTILNNVNERVGIIGADLNRDFQNNTVWHIVFAVHPNYRSRGYATTALRGLSDFLFRSFTVPQHLLVISQGNVACKAVARKCGFSEQTAIGGGGIAYYDPENMNAEWKSSWCKYDRRAMCFFQAVEVYRKKNYSTAIDLFNRALKEAYYEGTPYTDAQIYSNIGMGYQSLGMYENAFQYLKRAKNLGLTNASIEKELLWLRNNKGLY